MTIPWMRRLVGPALALASAAVLALAFAPAAAAQTTQTQELTDPGSGSDNFGNSVSISGAELVAGAPDTSDNEGAAYGFGYNGSEWAEQGSGLARGSPGDADGFSVAVSGSTMVVGARNTDTETGAAYVYTLSGGSWNYATTLTASDATDGAMFGYSVAISGSTIVVGAPGSPADSKSPGEAYVFSGSGSSWTQAKPLAGTNAGDGFGYSVATDGSTVVVGAPDSGSEAGSADVYTGSGMTWTFQTKLTVSGSTGFGWGVAIGGSTLAVGGYGRDQDEGSAYIFTGSGASWGAPVTLNGGFGGENFGYAVAVSPDGSQVVIGAPAYVGVTTTTTGAAYVYDSSGNLTEILAASDAAADDAFGWSVADSGHVIAVGAFNQNSGAGAVYTYGTPGPQPPTATTLAASNVTSDSATLNGSVDPDGTATSADFQWGTSAGYGTTTPSQSLGSGTSPVPVQAQLTNLAPDTTYHFQVFANGTIGGGDLTFTTAASGPPPCASSMTIGVVQVFACSITPEGGGSYIASGQTRFGNGTMIVDAGTQTPAALVLNTNNSTISIEPTVGGSPQAGELEAGGVDVATGDLVINGNGVTDPVSGVPGAAQVTGISSIDLSLSSWSFNFAAGESLYLAPAIAGGGAIADGQLALPAWLGDLIVYGELTTGYIGGLSGDIAVQANAAGDVGVLNGGFSFHASVLGIPELTLAEGELAYQRAGDEWSGSATLGWVNLARLVVNPIVIADGKLVSLGANFSCAKASLCGSGKSPTIGTLWQIKDIELQMLNLQGIDYTPFAFGQPVTINPCIRSHDCPPPPPPPQIDGAAIVGIYGNTVLAGANFTYYLDGAFQGNGAFGFTPIGGGTFSDPPALGPGQSAVNVAENVINSAHFGLELGSAYIAYTPPNLFQATGIVYMPNVFLKGQIAIGIDPPHWTGEGTLDLVVPGYIPIIGGDTVAGVSALVSDKAAAAEFSEPGACVQYVGCCCSFSALVAFIYKSDSFTVDINGGNINDFATVPLASTSRAGADARTVPLPAGKQLASFTIRSARGSPDVELIGPPGRGQRRLTLKSSRRLGNRSGALAWVDKRNHTETFLVFLPRGGKWKIKRLRGPKIVSIKIAVPRHKLPGKQTYPHATERAGDLPKEVVSTASRLTLHYAVPHHTAGTTVDLWAGTAPHGAGGVMIADGLPPSGAVNWSLSGLAPGRYWPYAIVNENGIPVSIEYWPRPIEVADPAAPPTPTGTAATQTNGGTVVYWNEVPAAVTYGVTATPVGGGRPVITAVPSSQLDALLALPKGKWSITVQAYDIDDHASLPSAPATTAVRS